MLTLTMLYGRYVDGAAGAWFVPTAKSDTPNFSISTGAGTGPGPLQSNITSVQSWNIFGPDLVHV